jgi:putative PIN family toxin of toxin-antitoxin system
MRAVVDTNVIVSGFISPGSPPDRVLQAWMNGEFELAMTPALLVEIEDVLSRPNINKRFRWSAGMRAEFVMRLQRDALVVNPTQAITRITADPEDNRVLEAAAESRADYIVTGDRDLLAIGEHEGTRIVTPARFLDILTIEVMNE